MNIPPRLTWRKLLAASVLPAVGLACGILVAAAYPLPPLTNPFAAHPVLAQVEPLATTVPNACVVLGYAGSVPVFRCVDEEQFVVCYSQSPMLYCLPQQ